MPEALRLDHAALRRAHTTYRLNLNNRHVLPDVQTCRILIWSGSQHWQNKPSFRECERIVTEQSLPKYWEMVTRALLAELHLLDKYDPARTTYEDLFPGLFEKG